MFFSTVVGSYPRPRWLIDQLIKLQGKQKESEDKVNNQVEEAFKEATFEVIQEQEGAGIKLITDGQLRWTDSLTYIADKITGFRRGGLIRYYDNNFYYQRPEIINPPKWTESLLLNDFELAKNLSKKSEVKTVLPGPYTLYKLSSNKSSLKKEELILNLGEVISKEVKALQEGGCKFIQIDEPSLVYQPPTSSDEWDAVKDSLEKIFKVISSDTTSMLYTYFAGLEAKHANLLDLKFDFLGLDFVSSPKQNLNFLAEQKVEKKLALGLFDARNVREEGEKSIKELIKEIFKHSNSSEVYLSPNCGLEFLPGEYAKRKLKLVSSTVEKLNQE